MNYFCLYTEISVQWVDCGYSEGMKTYLVSLLHTATPDRKGMVLAEFESLSLVWDMTPSQAMDVFGDEDAYDSYLQGRMWNLSRWLDVDYDALLGMVREYHNTPAEYREPIQAA